MSSEPIERRVSYIGDRLRASQCTICKKEYFRGKNYCGNCGRKSFGKMKDIDFFYEQGNLEVSTFVNQPTNRFVKMGAYIYGIVSFHKGNMRVPGRLTDILIRDGEKIDISCFDGKNVVPRFRRRYSVGESDIIPTISLAFTLADDYYPYQKYEIQKPKNEYEKPGIVGYGVYTSRFRIKEANMERSVPFIDEDAVTASVEAGKLALIHSRVDKTLVGKVYVGSESNPYAVNPIASKVAHVLKLGKEERTGVQSVDAIDTEFACKAATSMFKDASSLVYYPHIKTSYAMVIGSDNSQAAPRNELGGELDCFVGFGAAAFIFGMQDVIAEIEGWYSCTSDTPDFWRRDMQAYPRHGGRFTGEPAYFKHMIKSCTTLMEHLNLQVDDVDYFVPHQPNIRFPIKVAQQLGFKEEQYLPSLKVAKFGNAYSGSSPIGLAAVLDIAKPDERVLLVSYGSGAGSDAYSFITTSQLLEKRERQKFTVLHQIQYENLEYVDYHTYRRLKGGI